MSRIKLPKLGILDAIKSKAPALALDAGELALNLATGGLLGNKEIDAFKKKVKSDETISEADKKYLLQILQGDIDAMEIANEDRANARDIEVKLAMAGTKEAKYGIVFRYSLALLMIVGFFVVFGFALTHEIPEGNKSAVDILIGFLTGVGVGSIVNYFFGANQKAMNQKLLENFRGR